MVHLLLRQKDQRSKLMTRSGGMAPGCGKLESIRQGRDRISGGLRHNQQKLVSADPKSLASTNLAFGKTG